MNFTPKSQKTKKHANKCVAMIDNEYPEKASVSTAAPSQELKTLTLVHPTFAINVKRY